MLRRILNKITKRVGFNYLNTEIHKIVDENSQYVYYIINGYKIKIRKQPSSDYNVFSQVFINKEYEPPVSYFVKNNLQLKTVIDAGANIGLTSVYIKNHFPEAKIACIEPDYNNLKLLKFNLEPFIKDKSIEVYSSGLLGKSGLNLE